jgi:hypothetical protein
MWGCMVGDKDTRKAATSSDRPAKCEVCNGKAVMWTKTAARGIAGAGAGGGGCYTAGREVHA